MAVRLNLGAGGQPLPGYRNLDIKSGQPAYPLGRPDESADEIRASHILEHFSHTVTGQVLADWVRALKPGGVLKVAVPDFEKVARAYLGGADVPVQGYVMGGHVDADDRHGAIFDAECLTEALKAAGLEDIRPWRSSMGDCAALPVSLNLQGRKPMPVERKPIEKIGAAMSVPRLGFMDNFFCAYQALSPLNIGLRKHTGAFWGQCLTRCIEEWLAEGVDAVLAVDYDTVFTKDQVAELIRLMNAHPEADAIAPVQAHRTRPLPLITMTDADGKNVGTVPMELLDGELTRVETAHFGLTLIRASAFERLERPWFHSQADPDGSWGDGRVDEDIGFWRRFQMSGCGLYLANRVSVGHLEMMIRWPGQDLAATYQHPSDFWSSGPPEDMWR